MTVKIDLVETTSVRRTSKGYECERGFIVTGLAGSASARVVEAMEHTETPNYGEAHPDIPGLVVVSIDGEALTTDKVKLSYSYTLPTWDKYADPDDADPDMCDIRMSTSLETINTEKDADGSELTVTHDGDTQVATIPIGIPSPVLSFNRVESGETFIKARAYVGKVNSVSWLGAAEKTLLCTAIEGQRVKEDRYDVEYTFQYNPKTHKTWIFWVDPNTGRPVSDMTNDVEKKLVDVYETADFRELNLPNL